MDHGCTDLDDKVLGQQWGNTKVYTGGELLHCSAENCQERAVQSFLVLAILLLSSWTIFLSRQLTEVTLKAPYVVPF